MSPIAVDLKVVSIKYDHSFISWINICRHKKIFFVFHWRSRKMSIFFQMSNKYNEVLNMWVWLHAILSSVVIITANASLVILKEDGIRIWDKYIKWSVCLQKRRVRWWTCFSLYECIHKLLTARLLVRELIHSSSQCVWAPTRELKRMLSATYL